MAYLRKVRAQENIAVTNNKYAFIMCNDLFYSYLNEQYFLYTINYYGDS